MDDVVRLQEELDALRARVDALRHKEARAQVDAALKSMKEHGKTEVDIIELHLATGLPLEQLSALIDELLAQRRLA